MFYNIRARGTAEDLLIQWLFIVIEIRYYIGEEDWIKRRSSIVQDSSYSKTNQ